MSPLVPIGCVLLCVSLVKAQRKCDENAPYSCSFSSSDLQKEDYCKWQFSGKYAYWEPGDICHSADGCVSLGTKGQLKSELACPTSESGESRCLSFWYYFEANKSTMRPFAYQGYIFVTIEKRQDLNFPGIRQQTINTWTWSQPLKVNPTENFRVRINGLAGKNVKRVLIDDIHFGPCPSSPSTTDAYKPDDDLDLKWLTAVVIVIVVVVLLIVVIIAVIVLYRKGKLQFLQRLRRTACSCFKKDEDTGHSMQEATTTTAMTTAARSRRVHLPGLTTGLPTLQTSTQPTSRLNSRTVRRSE